jgi:RimJ/RimL family protein N-acetyltransferase
MLETPRLFIRPAEVDDAFNLFQLNSDPDVMRFTADQAFSSVLEAQNLIRNRMVPEYRKFRMSRFMVFLSDRKTFLGWCGLKKFSETGEVDLGYRFLKKYWSQGFATEASKVCLSYGFQDLNIERVLAKSMPDNIRSIKVILKLGMTYRGYVKDPTDPMPFVLFDIKKSDFKA